MKATIITIGDEILIGQVLDTNAQYISVQLTRLGIEVTKRYTISDTPEQIWKTVDIALSSSELVIVTGGLGPTKDDKTKQVLADYFGVKLVHNEEALEWIKELLHDRGIPLNQNNNSQAILPEDTSLLRNFKGTAAGMWFKKEGKSLISLPGVPFEMEHLMECYVIPELKKTCTKLGLDYRVLKVYDIPESALAERLEKWESALPEGIGLAYLPAPGWVRLRVTAKGDALEILDDCYRSLKEELTGLYFTEGEEGNIEQELGVLLRKRHATLSTAESCTGGYIAHLITSHPGSSDFFKGSVVAYSNEVKEKILGVDKKDIQQFGAVSEEVVRQMAEGARNRLQTDYAIATSGIAGPGGGTPEKPVGTVWIAISTPEKTIAQEYHFSFTRERNISKASVKALQLLMENV